MAFVNLQPKNELGLSEISLHTATWMHIDDALHVTQISKWSEMLFNGNVFRMLSL